MAEVYRYRTLRPSSRKEISVNYKIDTTKVTTEDTLRVEIDHEENDFFQTFWFDGRDLVGKDSIHFTAVEQSDNLEIRWSSVKPRLIPPPAVITLEPVWFEMGYYVYIVMMRRDKEKYFYVGMTGDRQHETARSPFYRMAGHFSRLASSTQNQVIKALKNYWPKEDLDSLLLKVEFSYYKRLADKHQRQ